MPAHREVTAEDYIRQTPPMVDAENEIEVVPVLRPDIALEVFMTDVLTINIQEGDENAPAYAEVSVNGRRIFIPRGQTTNVGFDVAGRRIPIQRMFIERLARAKRVLISQNLDPRLGEGINQLKRKRVLDYPFSVINDPNPIGVEWLKNILAEA